MTASNTQFGFADNSSATITGGGDALTFFGSSQVSTTGTNEAFNVGNNGAAIAISGFDASDQVNIVGRASPIGRA